MRSHQAGENGRRLFVGRLNTSTEEATMRAYFSRFGALADCVVMRFPDSLRSRGFGFVTFVDSQSLEECLASGAHWLDNRQLELSRAVAKEERVGGGLHDSANRGNSRCGGGSRNQVQPSKPALSSTEVDRRLFIGRLNFATEDESLRDYFGRWGELEDCIVMRWPETMKSRGFGFVTYRHQQSLEQCLAHAGPHNLDGSEIVLTRARNKADNTGASAGGVGGKRKWNETDSDDGDERFDPESKILRRLFLGRLNLNTTEDDLRDYFQRFGPLAEVVVMRFPDSSKSRGFGFITFEEAASVDACQKARPHELEGKIVECKRATARKDAKNPEAIIEVKKLWVGGFTEEISDDDIREYFGQFGGRVMAVEQIRWPDSGKKRGFGFVEFADTDTVDKICLIEKHRLKGRRLDIKKALSKVEMLVVKNQQQGAGGGNVGGGRDGSSYGISARGGGNNNGGGGGDGMALGSGGQQQAMGGMNPMMANMPNGMDMQSMFAMFMANMMNSMAAGGGGFNNGVGGGGVVNFGNSSSGGFGGGSGRDSSGHNSDSWGGGYSGSGSGPVRNSGGVSARDSANPYSRTTDASSMRRGW